MATQKRAEHHATARSGDLRAIQVGGRGQWRIDLDELEAYIQRCNAAAEPEIRGET